MEHGVYSPFMAGVQRMPNGNTLMMHAFDKRIVEVTPEGEIVLDFHVGRPGRIFRIYKHPNGYGGIQALGLDEQIPERLLQAAGVCEPRRSRALQSQRGTTDLY